jgi:hypothetical protein
MARDKSSWAKRESCTGPAKVCEDVQLLFRLRELLRVGAAAVRPYEGLQPHAGLSNALLRLPAVEERLCPDGLQRDPAVSHLLTARHRISCAWGRLRFTPASTSSVPESSKSSDSPQPFRPSNPIYGLYGSSYVDVDVNVEVSPFARVAKEFHGLRSLPEARSYPRQGASSPGADDAFDPHAPHLPKAIGGNFPGLYSSSGFDLMGVLARVTARSNPQIQLGPIDASAAFIVVDARKFDFPIIYASETFSKLTGYHNMEIVGKNCRFLQAPGGMVAAGSSRKHTDGKGVFHMKSHMVAGKETQVGSALLRCEWRSLSAADFHHQLPQGQNALHQPRDHHSDIVGHGRDCLLCWLPDRLGRAAQCDSRKGTSSMISRPAFEPDRRTDAERHLHGQLLAHAAAGRVQADRCRAVRQSTKALFRQAAPHHSSPAPEQPAPAGHVPTRHSTAERPAPDSGREGSRRSSLGCNSLG